MDEIFAKKVRAAEVAGWWTVLIAYCILLIQGFAYLLIEKGSILNICKCIAQFPKCNDKIESRLQNALISCHNSNEIKYFDSHVTMLFHVSVGLFQIVKHLYDDLTSRRHIDRRMHNKREKFVSDIEAQFGKPSFIS